MDKSSETGEIKEARTNSVITDNDEIEVAKLIKHLWSKRLFMLAVTSVFIVLGLIFVLTSPNEYEASATLIPESSEDVGELGGSIGGLASLAGFDLGGLSGNSQGINPALYQSVSQSTPFLLELIEQEYFFESVGHKISLYDFYSKHQKISIVWRIFSFPGKLLKLIKGSDEENNTQINSEDNLGDIEAIILTKDQESILKALKSKILVETDSDLNLVTIEVEMQDPKVAAQMVSFTQKYITDYVTTYAVSKSKQQLESVEEQYLERKKEFEQVQRRLALFRDRNLNVNTASAKSEEERLESEYDLAFDIYNQLSQKREAIKLQIQERTPVFTVLEPVKVPVSKSKPRRTLIMIGIAFFGGLVSVAYVLIKSVFFG